MGIHDALQEVSTAQSAIGSTGDFVSSNHMPIAEQQGGIVRYLRELGGGEPLWLEITVTETFASTAGAPLTGTDYFRFGIGMSTNTPLAPIFSINLGQTADILTPRLVAGAKFYVAASPTDQADIIRTALANTGLDITPPVDPDTKLPALPGPVDVLGPQDVWQGGGVLYGVYHRQGTYTAGAFTARFVDRPTSDAGHKYPASFQVQ